MPTKTFFQRMVQARSTYLVAAGMLVGYLAGIASPGSAVVRADITEEPRREAFKPGALVNEPLLREIAGTLKKIEQRVERIEKNTTPPSSNKK